MIDLPIKPEGWYERRTRPTRGWKWNVLLDTESRGATSLLASTIIFSIINSEDTAKTRGGSGIRA
jgi:hypothetical protein